MKQKRDYNAFVCHIETEKGAQTSEDKTIKIVSEVWKD